MMRQRLIFGSLMIAALAGLVLADAWLSSDVASRGGIDSNSTLAQWSGIALRSGFVLTSLVAVLAAAASLELGRLCEAGGHRPFKGWAAIISVALVLVPWLHGFAGSGLCGSGCPLLATGVSPIACLLCLGFIGICIGILIRQSTSGALTVMAITLFIMFYIGVLASFAISIRCLWSGPAGAAALVYFVLTVKCGDIGAFFTGSAIGRHKLVPWLSPGKTWEGAVGAVVGSVLMAELGMWLWQGMAATLGPKPFSAVQALVFAVLMAVFGHVGDLVESAMKRDVGAKDSARVVPAFGGLLDILDSPLLTAPLAWWLLTFFGRLS